MFQRGSPTDSSSKANVNVGSRFGESALMYARGLPAVKLLLRAGASDNDKDITGKTSLYWATQRVDPDAVQALIKAGANVNAKDDKGISALKLAKLEAAQTSHQGQAMPTSLECKGSFICWSNPGHHQRIPKSREAGHFERN